MQRRGNGVGDAYGGFSEGGAYPTGSRPWGYEGVYASSGDGMFKLQGRLNWSSAPDPVHPDERLSIHLESKPREYSIITKCIAEFLGDFTFVFIGIMQAIQFANITDAQMHAAFAHGLTIFVLVSTLGHISGGHFNPAVTLSIALTGKMPLWHVPLYWFSQLFGGFCAALVARLLTRKIVYEAIYGGATLVNTGDPQLSSNDATFWWQAVIAEALVTFFLCHTVLNTAVDTDKFWLAPLAIGFTLTIDILAVGDLTGASMNPARSFGPNLAGQFFLPKAMTTDDKVHQFWHYHYVYWIGPFAGASAAAGIHRLFEQRETRIIA